MSEMPQSVPMVLHLGKSAEGPMPIVVVVDDKVDVPTAVAYRDLGRVSSDAFGPSQLTPFHVPLEVDDGGDYSFGDFRPEQGELPPPGPTPALHEHFISDQRVGKGLQPVINKLFHDERVEIHVPPGTEVRAPVLDAPTLLTGRLGGVQIGAGDFLCLDLEPVDFGSHIEVSDVRCVYGVVPVSGLSQFKDIEELRVRIDKAPKIFDTTESTLLIEEIPRGRAKAVIHKVDYLELETGTAVDVLVTTEAIAAHLLCEGSSKVYATGADFMRIGIGPDRAKSSRYYEALLVDEGRVVLRGHYGSLINRYGSPMQVIGTIDRLILDTDATGIDLVRAQISHMADVFFESDGDYPAALTTTVFHAAPGCHPFLFGRQGRLNTTGSWARLANQDTRDAQSQRRVQIEEMEANRWRAAPSARYEAALAADQYLEQLKLEAQRNGVASPAADPLAPPEAKPGRVRDAEVHLDGFGGDLGGRPGSQREHRSVSDPDIRQHRNDFDGPSLEFDGLD